MGVERIGNFAHLYFRYRPSPVFPSVSLPCRPLSTIVHDEICPVVWRSMEGLSGLACSSSVKMGSQVVVSAKAIGVLAESDFLDSTDPQPYATGCNPSNGFMYD